MGYDGHTVLVDTVLRIFFVQVLLPYHSSQLFVELSALSLLVVLLDHECLPILLHVKHEGVERLFHMLALSTVIV